MSAFTIVAEIVAKPDSVDAVLSELLKIIEPTRNEEGCISYHLHQDTEKPNLFVFIENWKNTQAFEAHLATPHFIALVAAINNINDGITIKKLTPVA